MVILQAKESHPRVVLFYEAWVISRVHKCMAGEASHGQRLKPVFSLQTTCGLMALCYCFWSTYSH